MEQNKERAVNLTWTWYLLLTAIILMMVGIAIAWGLRSHFDTSAAVNNFVNNGLAVIIGNIVALILVIVFYYFDARDMKLIKIHVPKKYISMYFIAGMCFTAAITISVIYFSLSSIMINSLRGPSMEWTPKDSTNLIYGLGFGIIGLFGLISIGLYRYARLKMDLALMLRRHGENTNVTTESNLSNPTEVPSTGEMPTVSSGLTDNATKE